MPYESNVSLLGAIAPFCSFLVKHGSVYAWRTDTKRTVVANPYGITFYVPLKLRFPGSRARQAQHAFGWSEHDMSPWLSL